MSYQLIWDEKALSALEKLEKGISERIMKKLSLFINNPFSFDIKKLKGREEYRLRVGDYRIILEIYGNIISVLNIGHRSKIYED